VSALPVLSDPARLQELHGRMVESLLDGGGLHALAGLAAKAAGGRVVVDLARDGLAASSGGATASEGPLLRVPIVTGDEVVGTVTLHAEGVPGEGAADALHAAAMATLTYVALLRDEEPRDDTGARVVEALLDGTADAASRAARAGLAESSALVACVPAGRTGPLLAAIADHAPGAARTVRDGWVFALVPPQVDATALAAALHDRLGAAAAAAPSAGGATGLPSVLAAAQLGARLVAAGAASPGDVARGTWRLLVRAAVRAPEDVVALAAALGPLLDDEGPQAGEQRRTLSTYIANDCNMNATAGAMPSHRHTVAYRLERIRELTGLDPLAAEDREQLGVALKARAVMKLTPPSPR
jgi:PucR C-terminal helix-turn-helix domain